MNDRIAGLLYGSLAADSLALGAHWIYDQEDLQRDFGRVTELLAPRAGSYHPHKKRGEQTHYGDQALTLMDSLEAQGRFVPEAFARDWRRMWEGYPDYFDHATRETLESGVASKSEELGGAARIAPLLALMANGPVEAAVDAARAQTAITHNSAVALDAAEFLTRLVFGLLAGGGLPQAIEAAGSAAYAELDVPAMWVKVRETSSLDTAAAAKALGLACPAPQALPALLMLLERHGGNFETAAVENVMAGGDNAARGLALGMILGAAHGKAGVPSRWVEGLEAAPRIGRFLESRG